VSLAAGDTPDVIDSRDLIALLEELEAMDDEPDALDDDELETRDEIRELAEQGITDWIYGATLIRDDYFERYAQEVASDIGAIDKEAGWPLAHIDWEAAADALKRYYMQVSYLGVDYWARA